MTDELTIVQPDTLAALVKAETESAVDIAKRYPRDIKKIKQNVLAYATADQETAASCFYAKPVDGKNVEGPGIRLAEIIAATYQNIRYGSRIIGIDDKFVTVQGVCHDLENNNSFTAEVKRSIYSDKNQRRYGTNMIETTSKAASAIAVRDAIFKVVPMGLFNSELKEIKKVATGANTNTPLKDRFMQAVGYFEKLGVSMQRIMQRIELESMSSLAESHLETLTGLRTALKEEQTTLEEAFPETRKEVSQAKAGKAVDNVLNQTKK